MESNFQLTGPIFKEEPPMTPQDIADAKGRRDAGMTKTNETEKPPSVNEAVRAKIARLRDNVAALRRDALELRARKPRLRRADDIEWAANALEAVLDAAPCRFKAIATECGLPRTSTAHVYDVNGWHHYQAPRWLEAALTRAITKGEQ